MPPPVHRIDPSGVQVLARFTEGAASRDSRAILDLADGGAMHEIVIQGENVRLNIESGTSGRNVVERVQTPARFTVMGSCTIIATHDDLAKAGRALVSVKPASSGCPSEVWGVESTPGDLQNAARRVVAIEASDITVNGFAISLAIGEKMETPGAATLISGALAVSYQI